MDVKNLEFILQYAIYPIAAFAFYQYKQLIKQVDSTEAKTQVLEKEIVRLYEMDKSKSKEITEARDTLKEVDNERHEVNARMATFEAELKGTHKAVKEVKVMLREFLDSK